MNSYVKTFLRGSAVSLAGAILLGVINFFTRRQLSVELSIADYGTFYGIFSFYSIVFCFTELGLAQSGTVMIASVAREKRQRDKIFSNLFWIKTLLASICAIAAGIFCSWQYGELSGVVIFFFSGFFVCKTLNNALQALWNGQKKYTVQQSFYTTTAILIFLCLSVVYQITLMGAVFFFFFATMTTLGGGLLYSRITGLGKLSIGIDRHISKTLLANGGMIAVSTTLISATYHLDSVMLNALQGAESVGMYNVALPIMQIVQAAMVFPAVFLPIAVDLNKNQEYLKLLSFVRYSLLVTLGALLPVGIFFYYSAEFLINLLFDERYIAAAPAIPILCLGLVFFTAGNFFMQIMIAIKKIHAMALISLITFLCNLVMNYTLIKKMNFCGAAWAMLLTHAIMALLCYIVLVYCIKKLNRP